MTAPTDQRTADEGDAAERLDRAIEAQLAGRSEASVAEDDSLEATARILAARLPRLHPRFGFEDRLAQHLRAQAADVRGTVVELPPFERASDVAIALDRAWRPGRWSLIGAIASGVSVAVTLGGAVVVVLWRRARGSERSEGIA